ncbi:MULTISPECIES: YgaP family membrane protein [Caldisericum]|jgi:hypothetical protein|uniref:YgaP family membrane protein n=1 Tax=Caldisericum TaxID=693074 RepID=UPI0039FBF17A
MRDRNINTIESIIRVALGVFIFFVGYEITDFVGKYESGGFPHSNFYGFVFKFHNPLQVLLFFVGFVLFLTGITGFCPFKKLFLKR